jgi:hypothetical protein
MCPFIHVALIDLGIMFSYMRITARSSDTLRWFLQLKNCPLNFYRDQVYSIQIMEFPVPYSFSS